MHRNEMMALVAGASVGVGGGMLGAFLAWTASGALVHRVLDPFGDQYIELSQPEQYVSGVAGRHAAPAECQGGGDLHAGFLVLTPRSGLKRDRCPGARWEARYLSKEGAAFLISQSLPTEVRAG
jgi:hypothetical protein